MSSQKWWEKEPIQKHEYRQARRERRSWKIQDAMQDVRKEREQVKEIMNQIRGRYHETKKWISI